MKKIGEIAMIVNGRFAVLKATEPLILGSELLIYNELASNTEDSNEPIILPKGKLMIVMAQSGNNYLVSVITKTSTVENAENSTLAKSLSLYTSLFGKGEIALDLTTEALASYSARMDTKDSLNMNFNILVQRGDFVGFVPPTSI